MADKVRIGLIGCGGIAHLHVSQLMEIPEAQIVALNDINRECVDSLVAHFPKLQGVPVYHDYKQMMDEIEMDAVEIATPHTLHFQQAMHALDKGLHVLIEKPMVCTVEDAKNLIAKQKATGKVVLLSYQRHYMPEFRYMKRVVEEGKLGETMYISALLCQNYKNAVAGTWRLNPDLSGGGQLNDSGSHVIDAILWVSGLTVDEVYAKIDNRGTPVDIDSAIAVKFSNGALGTVSIVGDAPVWHEDYTISGEQGAILYRNGNLTRYDASGQAVEITDMPERSNPDRNFIGAILGREEVECPTICGLRVIELTEAAWNSGKQNRPIELKKA